MWVFVIAFLVVLLTYWYITNTSKYGSFEAHGIVEPPKYFPLGSVSNWNIMLGKVPFFLAMDEYYRTYSKDHKYVGTFINSRPVLLVTDLDVAREILIKDFDHFTDRRSFVMDESTYPNKIMANMLTSIKGEKWKKVRNLLSPAFTSGKLKAMFPFIDKVGLELVDFLDIKTHNEEEFSAKEALTSYTLDCIATCGFGVEANSFKDPDGQFRKMVFKATGGEGKNKKIMFNIMIILLFPSIAKLLRLNFMDNEALLFFADVVKKAVAHRRENNLKRGDLIDLILEALENSDKISHAIEGDQFERDAAVDAGDYKIAKDEIEILLVANAIILFFAGFETTSTSLAVTFGFLAKHPDIQEKLYQEINDAMDGQVTLDYHTLQSLPFLDQVFNETLRFYFSSILERECSKEYKLPGTEFVVPKGMLIQIPSKAMHHDDRHWPDAKNFNPEVNFSPEGKKDRSPYTFLSFGHGPRNCIGMRLAYLMAKMCLVNVVSKFEILSGPKMPDELVMGKTTNGLPDGGIWCKVKKRTC